MTMPSPEKYGTLISKLRQINRRVDATNKNDDDDRKARLIASCEALQEVILYLQADRDVWADALTRPLGLIENALRDASKGAAPALLDHAPDGKGKKPTGTAREEVQGGIVAAIHMLTLGSYGTAKAAEQVTRLADKERLRCADGTPIRVHQIRNWYSEYNKGHLPDRARGAFAEFEEFEQRKPWFQFPRSHPLKRSEAERAARGIIGSLARIAPQTAPSPTARLKE